MASKRDLKKSIKFICGDIAGECLFSETAFGLDEQKIAQVIINLAELQDNSIANVSFSYDKSSKEFESYKEYRKAKAKYNKLAFNALKEQFNKNLQAIVKDMNSLMPKKELAS